MQTSLTIEILFPGSIALVFELMSILEEVVTDWSLADAIFVWGGRERLRHVSLVLVEKCLSFINIFQGSQSSRKGGRWCRCTIVHHMQQMLHGQWVAFLVCWQWQWWLWQWDCRLDWTMVLSSPATKVRLMTETSRVIIIIRVTESGEMQREAIGDPRQRRVGL